MQLFLAQVFKDMAVSHLFGGPTGVKHGTNDWANKGLRREDFSPQVRSHFFVACMTKTWENQQAMTTVVKSLEKCACHVVVM